MRLFVTYILRGVFGCPGLDIDVAVRVFISVCIVAMVYENYNTWTYMSVSVLVIMELA